MKRSRSVARRVGVHIAHRAAVDADLHGIPMAGDLLRVAASRHGPGRSREPSARYEAIRGAADAVRAWRTWSGGEATLAAVTRWMTDSRYPSHGALAHLLAGGGPHGGHRGAEPQDVLALATAINRQEADTDLSMLPSAVAALAARYYSWRDIDRLLRAGRTLDNLPGAQRAIATQLVRDGTQAQAAIHAATLLDADDSTIDASSKPSETREERSRALAAAITQVEFRHSTGAGADSVLVWQAHDSASSLLGAHGVRIPSS